MILPVANYLTLTAQSLSGDALAAATAWCSVVSAALAKMLLPYVAEPVTITDDIHDAPPSRDLLLHRRPVRSITSVYLNPAARGQLSAFTSEYLLDNTDGDEYQLAFDDPTNSICNTGILRRVGTGWGGTRVRHPDRLAPTLVDTRGSIKVSYLAGPLVVPEDIQGAAVHLVTKMMNSRKFGTQVTSASLNGASYSLPSGSVGNFMADPTVYQLLSAYLPGIRIGG